MVLPDSHGIPRAPRYSGTSIGRYFSFAYGAITHYGCTFQSASTRKTLFDFPAARYCNLTTPHNSNLPTRTGLQQISLGSYPFAHHYSGNRLFFLFLGVLRWFNSPRIPL